MLARMDTQSLPAVPAPGWTMTNWDGAIGGSALALDPDPNVTPPSALRVHRSTLRGRLSGNGIAFAYIGVWALGGTTISVQPHLYDDVKARWLPVGAAVAVANGARAIIFVAIGLRGNWFVRITANTGVPYLGWAFV